MAKHISGREFVMAAKKASTWRTAVACGADDGVLITSESLGDKAPKMLPDDSMGNDDIMEIYQVSESINGASIEGYLRYEGWDVLIALALGTAGVPSSEGSNVYSNAYYPASNIDDLFASIAMRKGSATMTSHNIWEVPSASISGFTISANIGELAKITVNFSGNKIETESAVNTHSTMINNVTYPTSSNIARMDSSFKIRMNDQGGAALDDDDKIYPMGFTLTYNRPLSEDYSAGYEDMDQPMQDGFAEASIELNYDKFNIESFMDTLAAAEDDADYFNKMDITFSGKEAGDTGSAMNYEMVISIPKVKWETGGAPAGGPGKISHNVKGSCMAVSAAPTGMTAMTTPIYIAVQNERSTDPLA